MFQPATPASQASFDNSIQARHPEFKRDITLPAVDISHSSNSGVLSAIGHTPLIHLKNYLGQRVNLYVKMESLNPGGSAKDRPAQLMIEKALLSGEINRNTTIIESSSGNMGVALAQVCAYYGLDFICVTDSRTQTQNVQIMKALGAHIVQIEDPQDGDFLGRRWERVQALLKAIPDSYWPNQYANTANPEAHQEGTIREILEELGAAPDYLFVATSSTGTAQGCQNYLQKLNLHTQVIAIDSQASVLFGGTDGKRHIPGLGAGRVSPLAIDVQFDQVKRVSDLDCVVGCRRMALREAMLIGGSAGGVMETIYSMEPDLHSKTCVAILHDSGTRYLDTVFSDEWVQSVLGGDLEEIKRRVGKRRVERRNRYFATGFPLRKNTSRIITQSCSIQNSNSEQVMS
ncbi:MAG: 2,3-diaminopropionate biosynthesis protein SbnA [Planctomycetaceae bacterium]